MIFYNYIKENILVPRNIESRKEKLRQDLIKFLSQEIIKGDLRIDETFLDIQDELVKVKEIYGNVTLLANNGFIPTWLKDVKIYGNFDCSFNNLTSLKNCPQYIKHHLFCNNNKLTSLEGCAEYIGFTLNCSKNILISLKGCPKKINWNFICSVNNLESLKHGPEYVEVNFDCDHNKLTSLEGCPKYIGGNLFCRGNKIKLELPEGVELKGDFNNAYL